MNRSKTGKNQRVLVIAPSYTPTLNPRAFRWTAIAEEWVKSGWSVQVICSWFPGQLRQETINGVKVDRVGGGLVERLRGALRSSSRATSETDTANVSSERSFLSSLSREVIKPVKFSMRLAHDLTWKNLYWPDYACLWAPAAIRQAQTHLKQERYDALVTVSDPFTSHLVGLRLKDGFPELPWTVDIGDPFCFRYDIPTNNHALYQKLNHRKEREVFSLAEKVTVTTEATRAEYARLFPESTAKIEVIGPLVPRQMTISLAENSSISEKIKLVFVGTLYRELRNPDALLELFSRLLMGSSDPSLSAKLELHFYGGSDECLASFQKVSDLIDKKIFLHGLVSREKVIEAVKQADLLVNISNNNRYQLPSKVVEYACSGKPIINICGIANDCSQNFLVDHPATLNLVMNQNSDFEAAALKLESFIAERGKVIDRDYLEKIRQRHTAESIARAYSRTIVTVQPEEILS